MSFLCIQQPDGRRILYITSTNNWTYEGADRMSSTLTSSGDQPRYLERQNAVYIDRVTDEEDKGATVAYYLHSRDSLFLGTLTEDGV